MGQTIQQRQLKVFARCREIKLKQDAERAERIGAPAIFAQLESLAEMALSAVGNIDNGSYFEHALGNLERIANEAARLIGMKDTECCDDCGEVRELSDSGICQRCAQIHANA